MIIIAFSEKTSKILPRIVCRKFKHVAPIICKGEYLVMLQFVRPGVIEKIKLNNRDLSVLARFGWVFVYLPIELPNDFSTCNIWSCVGLAKRATAIHAPIIQTPDALYKMICN